MSDGKFAFSFWGLVLWVLVFTCTICRSRAALKTFYVEDLCDGWSNAFVDLRHHNTGILSSIISPDRDPFDCTIKLKPRIGSSVVLSLYRYNLGPQDQLIIEDSQQFGVALIGRGDFSDERKSFTSDGTMTLRYTRSNSSGLESGGSRMKFQFVFTEIHEEPCGFEEFRCRNGRCIPDNLVCDRHNHCGDNSDQQKCSPSRNDEELPPPVVTEVPKVRVPMIIGVIVCGVILAIVVFSFVGVLIRNAVRRKKKAGSDLKNAPHTVESAQSPTAPPAAIATAEIQASASPSVFNRIRNSFRSHRMAPPTSDDAHVVPEESRAEGYQVPSMYPHIPSAPQSGIGADNVGFKPDD